MKVFLNEEESHSNVDWCIRNYGKELFSKTFGGNEEDTEKEMQDKVNIRRFTNVNYGKSLDSNIENTISDLRKCVSTYSKVLEPKNEEVFRGTSIKLRDFIKLFGSDVTRKVDYIYKPKSPIQSWAVSLKSAASFYDISNKTSLVNLINKLAPILIKDKSTEIGDHVINSLPPNYLDYNMPIILQTNSTIENKFLFKPSYFRRLSRFQHEYELIRIDQSPIKCTMFFNSELPLDGVNVNQAVSRFIEYIIENKGGDKIQESPIVLPNIRIPNEDKNGDYRNINYNNIELIELGDDGGSIINLGVKFPNEQSINDGVAFDVQIINDELYHPHIHISKNLQGQGIGFKVMEKFIHEFGHMYITEARTLNKDQMPKIINKLENSNYIETYKTKSGGKLFILKNNPDKEYLISKYVNFDQK